LVHQLGLDLSCGAHVVELRRLRIGNFGVEKAISYHRLMSLEDLAGLLIPIGDALDFLPRISLSRELSRRIRHGMPIRLERPYERTFLRLYEMDNFLGVGLIEDNMLKPYRLMREL
jgi:tRNA pseudouridine55 synthase